METEPVNSIFDTNSLTAAFGITPTELLAAVIIVAMMVIGFWAIVKYNSSDRVASPGLMGSKGGRVRKTTIEYDGDPDKI